MVRLYGGSLGFLTPTNLFGSIPRLALKNSCPSHCSFIAPALTPWFWRMVRMQRRVASQDVSSASRPAAIISTSLSVASTTSVSTPSPATTTSTSKPLPPPPATTIVITSTLAASPPPITSSSTHTQQQAATTSANAVYTTVTTQVLTTIPSPSPIETPTSTTASDSSFIFSSATTVPTASPSFVPVYGTTRDASSLHGSSTRSSASARASSSSTPLPNSAHKSKSNVGKYVGYAIGGVFLLLFISSFISAYRKHRKYIKRRPRGTVFADKLSSGQEKRSIAQAIMHSVSNSSFDAYALCTTPPASPTPAFVNGRQQVTRPDILPTHVRSMSGKDVRPLPATPTKYEDPIFFPRAPVEHSRYSPFGLSSSGSSTI
ncbi:unnamed protein product [Mycena citricolor]|uniref:Transmembrane protein n=1 Tax=Mycena citricolor TaxID=2018698 RepID=A0AAD2K7F4_9AGAR|nr:unnamed protein product [Mycena citricolor]